MNDRRDEALWVKDVVKMEGERGEVEEAEAKEAEDVEEIEDKEGDEGREGNENMLGEREDEDMMKKGSQWWDCRINQTEFTNRLNAAEADLYL